MKKNNEKNNLEPDYTIPDNFKFDANKVETSFMCDYIYCNYSYKVGNNVFHQKITIPYFEIDDIIDKGNHIQINLNGDITPYNAVLRNLNKDTPIFVYFEYEFEKMAVIEHFNNLKKYI